MNTNLQVGKEYRVVKAPQGEYLTVGGVYVLDSLSKSTVGLHRSSDGAGTYVTRWAVGTGRIVLEAL